jgi:hypothetical protein
MQMTRLAYKPDPAGQMIFALRSDGQLLCCSYLREQQVIGWSHFDTQGTFEDICVVPENNSFGLYAITKRVINGATVRYVERWASREVTTPFDYKFLDCASNYDGRNTGTSTMTLTGGTTWLAGDTGTLTASSTSGWTGFASTDPGLNNEIWLYGNLTFAASVGGCVAGVLTTAVTPGAYQLTFADGEARSVTVNPDGQTCTWQGPLASGIITTATFSCRLLLTAFTSSTVCSVRLKDPCPVGLRGISTLTWTFARTQLTGATQLAGMQCVALVDGNVFGINSTSTVPNGNLTVSVSGVITLPSAGGVVQIGLPYVSDFETLSLNEQGQETIRMRSKANPVIYLDVAETRNFLAGTDYTNLAPNVQRAYEPYTSATQIQNGVLWTRLASTLDSECHSCIRQNMPLPITIRMHIPQVTVGEPVS